jgi:hypothetical protein
MAQQYYMALPDVGPWDVALESVHRQLRPYKDYLRTAVEAAKRRSLVLSWRRPRPREQEELDRRLRARFDGRKNRTAPATPSRRRDRRERSVPEGTWVVLEPPPWRTEDSEKTLEAFLEAEWLHEDSQFARGERIRMRASDWEGRALLLERLPVPVAPPSETPESPPSATRPHGPLLWLLPNTYTLERQQHAVWDLENAPTPRLGPLVRLLLHGPTWPSFEVPALTPERWVFLRPRDDEPMRDGTEEQRRFVEVALATPDFSLLNGPPGSGKTMAICELIVQLVRAGKRVLLVASTHVAVDNVLERLLDWQDSLVDAEKPLLPVRIGDEGCVTSEKVKPWIYSRLLETWRDELLDFLDEARLDERPGAPARALLREAIEPERGAERSEEAAALPRLLLESANLVCGTTIGILQHPAIKAMRGGEAFAPFDLMILDEASKTTFSEFLVPARHAERWVISGDVKQLSPYVQQEDLAESLRGLVPELHGRAAVHAFLASSAEGRSALQPSLFVTPDGEARQLLRAEAEARQVLYVDLDDCQSRTLHGVDGAIPELLYANLVIGTAQRVRELEHRLPPDLLAQGGEEVELDHHHSAQRAYVGWASRHTRKHPELADHPPDWAHELAWRMVRAHELRRTPEAQKRYLEAIEGLLPASLGDAWFAWRKLRPWEVRGEPESAQAALRRELDQLRRVTMPSILELLQSGANDEAMRASATALASGLPPDALALRLRSLRFQHRMHHHISAFPRERFYSSEALSNEAAQGVLLQDASRLREERDWRYSRYSRRAVWIDVAPQRGWQGAPNANRAEAAKVLEELVAFERWAKDNPCRLPGRKGPWEVAVLAFHGDQETLLRAQLQRHSGQTANTREFTLGEGAVHVTLCTVDAFQGHEADLVLLSFVKSGSVGFLDSPNRLNVALTRARFQVVLVGHRSWFEKCRSTLLRELATSPHYAHEIGWEVTS